jgi:hypothetical protein
MKIDFASTRLAFFLIALLTALITISALIPQKDIATGQVADVQEALGDQYYIIETLKLDEIYTAPYFFIVLGLLAVNLAAGNIRRFRSVYRAERSLLKARHLGSIVFHLSLLVIMLGIILNYLYRFEGVFSLTEGQTLAEGESDYFRIFRGPLYEDDFGRFSVALETLHPAYPVDDDYTEAASMTVQTDVSQTALSAVIMPGQPLQWRDLEFHMGSKSGYSPELVLSDSAGNRLFASFVRLATRKAEGHQRFRDFLILPDHGLKITIEAFPEGVDLSSTTFRVTAEDESATLCDSTAALGETIICGPYDLTIPRLRRWCYISVVESPFLTQVFVGFWTALAGMTIGFAARLTVGRKNRA